MENNMNNNNEGEIILYQPNQDIRLEVRIAEETVWLSQAQMAELFGTQRQAITKHLKNIFDSQELTRESTSSVLELLRQEVVRIYADEGFDSRGAGEESRIGKNENDTESLTYFNVYFYIKEMLRL